MRIIVSKICLATTVLIAGLAFITAQAQAEWRGWNIHVPDYPVSAGMDKFTSLIAEKTAGRVTGKTYHGGVLGAQPDAIKQVQLGALDFAVFNMGPMGPIVPEANVVSLPFIFKSVDHMHRVMDGSFGDKMRAAMEKKGLVALAWYDSGARSFYNSIRAVNTPSDMVGLKFRVMGNPMFVNMVEKLGGNATPMAFSEVFQSLKTGVIDGAENNWPSYESTNHYEVAKYYSLSQHLILPECLCVSTKAWNAISDEDKAMVRDAARESAVLQRKLWAERAAASRQKVEAGGVIFNTIANKAPFQEAMLPVYAEAIEKQPFLKELIADIKSVD